MKKLFSLLIITTFIGLFCKPITSNANEVLDRGVKEIDSYGEFNYFRGVTLEEYKGRPLDIFYGYFDGTIEEGELKNEVTVENTNGTEYVFMFKYQYTQYSLYNAKVYFDNTLIYEAEFEGENITQVKTSENIIVEEKTKISGDYFTIKSYSPFEGLYDFEYDSESLEDIGLFLIQGHKYRYNEAYKDKDVYFISPIDNLLSFEDIESKISASDSTDGDLTENIEIYNNTYDPTNEEITVGDYSFDVVIYDSSGNLTYQTCYVKVVDTIPPVITASDPMDVTYTIMYPWSTFLKKFTTSDNVAIEKIEVTEDTYTENYNIPGTYHITATATDTSGNTASAVLTVNVVDKVAPVIDGPYEIKTTTLNPLTKEEIRDYFTFSDVIDPEVTNYKIMDADEYFENPKLAGEYLIRICAYDMYNNEGVKHVKLIVLDLDFPAISIDSNNTIIVEKGAEVTKEQIIEFLNASGMLEGEVVDVSIEGYDEENPSGSYEMSIELADGTVINNKLVIREDVNYETPLVEKDYSIVIVVCVVCGILLVVSTLYFGNVSRRRVRR